MPNFVTRRSQIPGSRFIPTNPELINILRRKANGGKSSRFVTDMDIYEKEPWLLQHVRHFRSKANEWYYFGTRKKPPGIKKEDSKRISRKVGAAGFTWKSNVTTSIVENGEVIGTIQNFAFVIKKISTGWVMHEFVLNIRKDTVLCRIRFNPGRSNAQYAPRLEPIVIGKPQGPPREEGVREEGLTLVENKINDLYVVADENIKYVDTMPVTHLGMEKQQQWIGSCPREAVSYPTAHHQQFMRQADINFVMNGSMKIHQDFGSCASQCFGGDLAEFHISMNAMKTQQGMEPPQQDSFVFDHNVFEHQQKHLYVTQQDMNQDVGFFAQCSGGDSVQNHHSMVLMETGQGMEPQQQDNSCSDQNVVEHQTTKPPYLTQELKNPCQQTTDLPINQDIDEQHMSNTGSFTHNELFGQSLEVLDENMANFGDEEWAKQLGVNTPEEEAELRAALGNCNTIDSFLNYFC